MALKDTMKEYKEFAVKGNVVDMAVGVIVGGAFSKIVTSFVNDLIMPVIGKITGGHRFHTALPASGRQYICNLGRGTGSHSNHRLRLFYHTDTGFPDYCYCHLCSTKGAGKTERTCGARTRRSTYHKGMSFLQI